MKNRRNLVVKIDELPIRAENLEFSKLKIIFGGEPVGDCYSSGDSCHKGTFCCSKHCDNGHCR
jgi:hypothetical protein